MRHCIPAWVMESDPVSKPEKKSSKIKNLMLCQVAFFLEEKKMVLYMGLNSINSKLTDKGLTLSLNSLKSLYEYPVKTNEVLPLKCYLHGFPKRPQDCVLSWNVLRKLCHQSGNSENTRVLSYKWKRESRGTEAIQNLSSFLVASDRCLK